MKQWKHCTSDLHLISSGMSSPTKVNLKRPAPSFLSELRMSSSRSSQSVCRPWNRQDFQQRVSTFQIQTWFAKPVAIGSLVCARHGWVNIKADTLQCRGCKKMLVFQFKAQLGPQVRLILILILVRMHCVINLVLSRHLRIPPRSLPSNSRCSMTNVVPGDAILHP